MSSPDASHRDTAGHFTPRSPTTDLQTLDATRSPNTDLHTLDAPQSPNTPISKHRFPNTQIHSISKHRSPNTRCPSISKHSDLQTPALHAFSELRYLSSLFVLSSVKLLCPHRFFLTFPPSSATLIATFPPLRPLNHAHPPQTA